MSCCGEKRAEAIGQATSVRASEFRSKMGTVAPAPAWNAVAGVVRVRYLDAVPVAVDGRYTGKRYLFSRVSPVQEMDTRDADGLLSTRYFREA